MKSTPSTEALESHEQSATLAGIFTYTTTPQRVALNFLNTNFRNEVVKSPNWCINTLSIQGKKEVVDETRDYVKDEESPLSFNSVIPMPEGLVGTRSPAESQEVADVMIEQYGYPSWYEWSIANWGTKWDLDEDVEVTEWRLRDVGLTEDDIAEEISGITYRFSTAWDPPIPVIQTLSEKFPTLHIQLEYDDPDMDCWGFIIVNHGEITHEEEGASRMNEEMPAEDEETFLEVEEDIADNDF